MKKLLPASLVMILISSSAVAQDKAVPASALKNHPTTSSPAANSFKAQSSSVGGKTAASKNGPPASAQNGETANHSKITTAGFSGDHFPVSEIMKTDYPNMPVAVKSKINTNKNQGNNLLDGIAKGFTVEIKACKTDTDQQKILSFLRNNKGFINSEFVSPGVVRIIVEPYFDSVELKNLLGSHGVEFNFLDRFYLLKR